VKSQQALQKRMRWRSSRMDAARALASSAGARRMWKASRAAVF
jgi:hypothetical protein